MRTKPRILVFADAVRTVRMRENGVRYEVDFEQGHKGFRKIDDLLARYADQLADAPADRERLRAGGVAVSHLDYDWSLNALGR